MGVASKILHAGIRDIAALNTLQLLAIDIGNRFPISSLTPFEIPRRESLRYAPGIPFSQSRTTPSREWRPNFSSLSHALVLARLESSAVAAAPGPAGFGYRIPHNFIEKSHLCILRPVRNTVLFNRYFCLTENGPIESSSEPQSGVASTSATAIRPLPNRWTSRKNSDFLTCWLRSALKRSRSDFLPLPRLNSTFAAVSLTRDAFLRMSQSRYSVSAGKNLSRAAAKL